MKVTPRFFLIFLLIMNNLAFAAPAVKLRPRIHFEPLPQDTSYTLDSIRPFIRDSLILQSDDIFAMAPTVISFDHERATGGKGNLLFACGINSLTEQLYTIYRPNRFYVHPITKECLGYEAEVIGTAKMNVIDRISELEVLTAREGIEIKAKLLPNHFLPPLPEFSLQPATTTWEGYILAVKEGREQIGRNQVVVLSIGCREGVKPGDLLDIFQTSTGWSFCSACPIRLTDNKIGRALIFRAYDKLSLALIVDATEIISVLDKVRSP